MKDLYLSISEQSSNIITKRYSTSFSMGILMLSPHIRRPIRNIYGFVRLADEIVDTFHQHDKAALLEEFKRDTWQAIERGISTNPVLHAFQHTVHQYQIPHELIRAFLHSMEMDLSYSRHENGTYHVYIYGSAEVVGLMCLQVFCEGDSQKYAELVEPARKLGAAFQKINFLRDLQSDLEERGRLYFPNLPNILQFDYASKQAIEADIENDFQEARKGILRLPAGARFGVYVAYIYFYQLLKKIKQLKPRHLLEERVRVSNSQKIMLLARGYLQYRMNIL